MSWLLEMNYLGTMMICTTVLFFLVSLFPMDIIAVSVFVLILIGFQIY